MTHPVGGSRRQPAVAAVVLALGMAGVLSVHVWSATWSMSSPSPTYALWYLWTLVPFALLAVIAYRGGLRWKVALGVCALVEIGALAGLNSASSLTGPHAATYMPPLMACVVLAGWWLEARFWRTWTRATQLSLIGIGAWLAAVAAGLLVVRRFSLGDVQTAESFAVVFVSIAVEALPFVLLGAAVSALIEVFVPSSLFTRVAGLPLRLQVPGAALAGVAMPVCECGSVPVARRLIARGVHPAAGVAFMLASPVLNPVVLLSTAIAYQGRGAVQMVLGRAVLGFVVAVIAGAVLARRGGVRLLGAPAGGHHHHDHRRVRALLDHTASEAWFMGRFVVAGAAVAAILQTAVPQSVFAGVLTTPVVGAALLMVLAFVLSLCSEADAFVAVSLAQFDYGPQLAFLLLGPVLDVKLAMLYGATFGRRFVLRLALVAAPTILVLSLVFGALFT